MTSRSSSLSFPTSSLIIPGPASRSRGAWESSCCSSIKVELRLCPCSLDLSRRGKSFILAQVGLKTIPRAIDFASSSLARPCVLPSSPHLHKKTERDSCKECKGAAIEGEREGKGGEGSVPSLLFRYMHHSFVILTLGPERNALRVSPEHARLIILLLSSA